MSGMKAEKKSEEKDLKEDAEAVEQKDAAEAPVAPAPAPAVQPAPPVNAPQPAPAAPVAQPAAPAAAPAQVGGEPIPALVPEQTPAQPAPAARTADVTPEQKMQEHMAFAEDLASGKIHPKTYQDLYNDKGTLGKIGTIFGLILSGAGSGLTHQPNLLMEMMNREIDRDLEKQKANIESGRNFMSLQYQHNLQQAQGAEHQQNVLSNQVDTMSKAAGASGYLKQMGVPGADTYLNSVIQKQQEIMAPFEAKAKAVEGALHYIDTISANNPRAAAMAKDVVRPMGNQLIDKTLKEGAAAANAVGKPANAAPMTGSVMVNQNKLAQAIRLGQGTPKGVPYQPGAIDPQHVQDIMKESKENELLRKAALAWNDSFNKISAMPHAGQTQGVSAGISGLSAAIGTIGGPIGSMVAGTLGHGVGKMTEGMFNRERNVQIHSLLQMLGPNMSAEQKEDLINSVMPTWQDVNDPKRMAEIHDKGMQHFKSLEATPVLDLYASQIPGLKMPFPSLPYKAAKANKTDANKSEKKDDKKEEKKPEPKTEVRKPIPRMRSKFQD